VRQTKRFELRAEKRLWSARRSCDVVREQTSELVLKVPIQRAEDILRQERVTVVGSEQFDKLMSSLAARLA
jgi:uncharacterized protein (DUF1778 family)